MTDKPLDGMRVLVLEDEFLIAMDVEQICQDHGASEVVILRSLGDLHGRYETDFHVAVLDVMLAGVSTLDFAARLREQQVPFVFVTGYADLDEKFAGFPGIAVLSKPYAAQALIEAIMTAIARLREGSGGV